MRRVAFSWILFAGLFLAPVSGQEIVPGRYIVELNDEPVAAAAAKSTQSARSAAVRNGQSRLRATLAARSVDVVDSLETVANALVVNASEEQAAEISQLPGVRSVRPVKLYKMLLDRAVGLQQITAAWARVGGLDNAGNRIKIGIIDSGVDASHPAFQDPSLTVPDGFPKVTHASDTQYTNNKVIVARNYDVRGSAVDTRGHGTGVAAIAAGVTAKAPQATITGIAPKAWIGNYKVFPDNRDGAPTDYILRALEDAVADGMDIINLSLGSFPAERLAEDPLGRAVENVARLGVLVTVASGNEGPDLNTIASPASAPSAIAVGNAFSDRIFASNIAVANLPPVIAVPGSNSRSAASITAPARDVSSIEQSGLACGALPPGSLTGRIALILRGTCLFEEKLTNAEAAGAVAALVYTHAEEPEAFTMGMGAAQLPAIMIGNKDGLAVKERLAAAADQQITLNFVQRPLRIESSRISGSSSVGPNNDFAIKPELVAVGTPVYTAFPDGTFSAASGTSFSAPMIAGAAALLKAARPGLTSDEYKSLLINSASTFAPGLTVQQIGGGLLQLAAAVRNTVTAQPALLGFGAGSATIDLTRSLTIRNIGSGADTYTISVVPTGGSAGPLLSSNTIQLAPGAFQDIGVRLHGSGLQEGAHEGFLVIRGGQSSVDSRVPYWYAVTSNQARLINVIEPPTQGRIGSRQTVRFRVLDRAGIPMLTEPVVTMEQGSGSIESVQLRDAQFPGLFVAAVRLGMETGAENVVRIESAGVTRRVRIVAE